MSGPSLAYPLYRLTWEMLDWVFPPRCAGCDRPGARWCEACRAGVRSLGEEVCSLCGKPQPGGMLCRDCRENPPHYSSLRSWGIFDGSLRKVVHRLKYRRDLALGQSLSDSMLPALRGLRWPVDLVLPIPLGKFRHRERGYNQAALIARPLSLSLEIDYSPNTLMRCRETRSQVGLSRDQRRENVSGVFQVQGRGVQGQTVLLVDDVATTGATLSSAAEALKAGGAIQVYAFTAARAVSTTAA